MNNPFSTAGYSGPQYFCNREKETELLINNISNRVSTTLISHRRLGKTGLIQHVIHKSKKDFLIIYVDILATENKFDLLNMLASSVAASVKETGHFGKIIWGYLKSLRPIIKLDELTGNPLLSVESKPEFINSNIESLLKFLDKQNKKIIIAIDEFQQIVNYPEKNVDAFLRSIYQQSKNLCFIFSGSKKHLMQSLFSDPSRPFYRSTQILNLDKIPKKEYQDFITKLFLKGNKKITAKITDEILEWANSITYYVQLLCSRVYMNSPHIVSTELWQKEAQNLLNENETVFFNYRDILTKNQWAVLKAIAMENILISPTSKDFMLKYSLGSSASILQSLNSLIDKEMVYYDFDNNGTKYYCVYDLLLQRYLQKTK